MSASVTPKQIYHHHQRAKNESWFLLEQKLAHQRRNLFSRLIKFTLSLSPSLSWFVHLCLLQNSLGWFTSALRGSRATTGHHLVTLCPSVTTCILNQRERERAGRRREGESRSCSEASLSCGWLEAWLVTRS